jgi:hypothetical protein
VYVYPPNEILKAEPFLIKLGVYIMFYFCLPTLIRKPITVAARSKAWNVFVRSNPGIMGSNPTRGMDVCVRLFCVCDVLCASSVLATGWSPAQGVLPTVYRIKKLKNGQGTTKGCRAIEREREREREREKIRIGCESQTLCCFNGNRNLFAGSNCRVTIEQSLCAYL